MITKEKIFSVTNHDFEKVALEIFQYQATYNKIYKTYIQYLNIDIKTICSLKDIPFMPVEFFKNFDVITDLSATADIYTILKFTSSGTTGAVTSKHYVTDVSVYEQSFMQGFKLFYGDITDYCFLALLPSYLEREGSSLIYMAEKLIKHSNNALSGFYLYNYDDLLKTIQINKQKKQKTILLGVTFALLDLAEKYQPDLNGFIIMETGGMKGRRKELTRDELHGILTKNLGVDKIHSEYGMTELLAQAYSKGDGIFYCPPWMRILTREIYDPFSYTQTGKTGGVNIIDLSNVNSCSFIETRDIGKLYDNGSFEISGRMDNSDIRGCNLMVSI